MTSQLSPLSQQQMKRRASNILQLHTSQTAKRETNFIVLIGKYWKHSRIIQFREWADLMLMREENMEKYNTKTQKKLKIYDKSLAKCVIHMQKGDSLYIYARSWYNLSTLAIILTISDLNSSKCCTISTLDLMFSTSWARFLSFANWETLFIFLDTSALCGLYCKAVWKALKAYNIQTEKT